MLSIGNATRVSKGVTSDEGADECECESVCVCSERDGGSDIDGDEWPWECESDMASEVTHSGPMLKVSKRGMPLQRLKTSCTC